MIYVYEHMFNHPESNLIEIFHVFPVTHKFTACEEGFGWPKFITVAQLRRNWLLVGGAVKVHVDLAIVGSPKSASTSRMDYEIPRAELL